MTVSSPRRVLLVSVPRSASLLLVKILNVHNQPHVLTNPGAGYFFFQAFMPAIRGGYMEIPLDQWTEAQKQEIKTSFEGCVENLEEFSEKAKNENKIMFAKEHAYWLVNPAVFQAMMSGTENEELFNTFRVRLSDAYGSPQTFSPSNKTVLPDEYLRSWQLTFIIRHPALAWPSMYRALVKIKEIGGLSERESNGFWKTNMTLRWTRLLYDWCLEQGDTPLLLDAEDVIHHPQVVTRFCEQTGMDKETLKFDWDGEPEEGNGPRMSKGNTEQQDMQLKINSIMVSSLASSSGIMKDKAPLTIDIAGEMAKWKAEFGEEAATRMEEAVLESMPDYEYLKARRLTV
ncbi:hypothetical protein BO71DRAFT_395246 [Aspergillus ellipticus CBS 707.79]|uniref:P-loop containing nucleoside triphosphate hydrolase protein n=1 Tax=Aspergillus ellipticus CBS 707.79 TaxID=1448320 RepID=A0A319DLQ9_9EURO|nr:hypothetical protein BO71DRAFT_395246 [Aspergillus ellipticus CBS 707.79]